MKCILRPGSRIDQGKIYRITADDIHRDFSIDSLTSNNRSIIFGGPAPFSRLDTQQAMEYASLTDRLLKYVNVVYGIYCQDAFVMKKFDEYIGKEYPNHGVVFYGDGDAFFARSYSLEHDFTHQGLSIRTGRYAMVLKNQIVEHISLDDYSVIEDTSAEAILKWLESN